MLKRWKKYFKQHTGRWANQERHEEAKKSQSKNRRENNSISDGKSNSEAKKLKKDQEEIKSQKRYKNLWVNCRRILPEIVNQVRRDKEILKNWEPVFVLPIYEKIPQRLLQLQRYEPNK